MRKLLVTTLLVGLGLTAGSHSAAVAGADGAALTLGTGCNPGTTLLYAGINGGVNGDLFDLFIDGNLVAENLGPDSAPVGYEVADGVHTVTLNVADQSTVVDEEVFGSSCGDPVIDIEAACSGGSGAFSIITNENTNALNYAFDVDGVLYSDGIGNSGYPVLYGPFPDGTYSVEVRAYGPSETSVTEEVEIDCVDGDGGEPASVDVGGYCNDGSYIGVELLSFTYGELFSVTIDGFVEDDGLFSGGAYFVATSGTHHVVITSTTAGVIFDDTVLVACNGPVAAAKATCEATFHIVWFKSLAGGKGYSFSVSVDGEPVPTWQDADDTNGDWVSLGDFGEGGHTVLIEWTHDEEDDGSAQFVVEANCTDDGSGTPLPDSGSNTTPLLLAAGLLVVAGLGMLGLRRRTA